MTGPTADPADVRGVYVSPREMFAVEDHSRAWLPTPEEIAASCAEIQAEWSDEERDRRAAWAVPLRYEFPRVRCASAGEAEPAE